MKNRIQAFAYLRSDAAEGINWIDVKSIRVLPCLVERYGKNITKEYPDLAKDYPFIRVIRVEVTDISEEDADYYDAVI